MHVRSFGWRTSRNFGDVYSLPMIFVRVDSRKRGCPNRGVDTVFLLRNQFRAPNFENSKRFIIDVARRLVSHNSSNTVDDDEEAVSVAARNRRRRANGIGLIVFDAEAKIEFRLTSPFNEQEFRRFEQTVNAIQPGKSLFLEYAILRDAQHFAQFFVTSLFVSFLNAYFLSKESETRRIFVKN